ncbi:UNVERIFIED_CONTAM: hypothetical protein FKN15_076603 [Acipenser sinensis]
MPVLLSFKPGGRHFYVKVYKIPGNSETRNFRVLDPAEQNEAAAVKQSSSRIDCRRIYRVNLRVSTFLMENSNNGTTFLQTGILPKVPIHTTGSLQCGGWAWFTDPSDAAPYSQLTHDELVALLVKQKEALSKKDCQIRDLEDYIDNLLVRVMEETPNILRNLPSKQAGTSGYD